MTHSAVVNDEPQHQPTQPGGHASSRLRATRDHLARAFGSTPFDLPLAGAAGVSRDRVERACTAGLVQRVARGTYAVVESGQAARARLTALRDRNPGIVACGSSAALDWGLPIPPGYDVARGDVEVAYRNGAQGRRGRRPGVVARRWSIPDGHVTTGPRGQLVTDPLRTAIDLARGMPLHLALIPLDAALGVAIQHGFTCEEARTELRTRWNQCRTANGMATVGGAIRHADPLAESPLESIVRGRILVAGLPIPRLQVPVMGKSGRFYRADLGLDLAGDAPGTFRLLIEADGMGKYQSPKDLADEKRRQHDLERQGHIFVRVLYDEAVHRPSDFLGTIRRLVAP